MMCAATALAYRPTYAKVEPEWRRLHRIADGLAPDLRQSFLRAMTTLRERLDPARLMDLLRAGDSGQLGAFWQAFESELAQEVRGPIREAFLQAATRTQPAFAGLRFDLTNPQAVQYIDAQAARLIRGATAETQAAIRRVIHQGFTQGLDVPTMARRICQSVGLTDRYAVAVENFRQGQLRAGVAPGMVERRAEAYTQRLIRHRAVTISRTETIAAANAGQQAVWREARATGLLSTEARQVWIITPDDRLCEICEAIPDDNPEVAVGGMFRPADGLVSGPPAHPGCRCAVGLEFPE